MGRLWNYLAYSLAAWRRLSSLSSHSWQALSCNASDGTEVDLENRHALAVVGRRSLPPGRCNDLGRCRHRHLASVDP